MTYDATESSAYSGNPVELYKFVVGTSKFLYTSTDSEHVYNSETYTPLTISRSSSEQTNEINRTAMKITVPRDTPIAELFIAYAPAAIVAVTVFRYHPSDGEFKAVWFGRVISPDFQGVKAVLHCEPVSSSMKRTGLRRNYQALCPHLLYGVACGVNQLTHQTTGSVTTISGGTLEVGAASAFADGYFNGGFIRHYTDTGLPDSRIIIDHVGSTLTIVTNFQELSVGDSVDVFPGCNHTMTDCDEKFENSENHGGFIHTPTASPFGGATVF